MRIYNYFRYYFLDFDNTFFIYVYIFYKRFFFVIKLFYFIIIIIFFIALLLLNQFYYFFIVLNFEKKGRIYLKWSLFLYKHYIDTLSNRLRKKKTKTKFLLIKPECGAKKLSPMGFEFGLWRHCPISDWRQNKGDLDLGLGWDLRAMRLIHKSFKSLQLSLLVWFN